MTPLAIHLEELLQEHERVAVPGFGTFAIQRVPLHTDDACMFYVPRRNVMFDTTIGEDNLLATYVSQLRGISLADGETQIAQWVDSCKCDLQENGVCDFGALGQFVFVDQQMQFEPCTAGLSEREFFGLDNLEMPLLPILTSQIMDAAQRKKDEEQERKKRAGRIVISLNRNLVHYAAAVAASVVLFFALTVPTASTSSNMASISSGFFLSSNEVAMFESESHPAEIEEVVSETPSEEIVETEPTAHEDVQEPTRFAVVVASSVKLKNAEAMVERLHKKGFDKAQVYVNKGLVRVAFLGYAERQAAVDAAANMRGMDEELEGAWVYEIK